MIRVKTLEEIAILREGGKRLAFILREIANAAVPGTSTADLNTIGLNLIEEAGDKAAFLNHQPSGAKRPYPAAVCVSVNDEVVHGIPNEKPRILKEGDIVSIDAGLIHKGMYTDAAITIPIGNIDDNAKKLLEITKKALDVGIAAARAGATTGDIGFAIQKYIEPSGFGIIEELCGHGVGYEVHEDPFVPNFGIRGRGPQLPVNAVIAIEPMLNEGTKRIVLDKDGYTYRTKDGKRSAHFEHTIVITANGAEVLTK
jgi:methionyl aminopeptidase